MGWLRWLTLAGLSALLSAALLALHMPAAVLLGCMVCALVFSVRGLRLAVPRRFFGWGQGLLGCLMAQSLHPDQLGQVLAHWPVFVGTTVLLIATSSALGWWLMRRQVMPGTTAVWEQALDMVQTGEMSLEAFVAKQSAWMSKQVERCAGLSLNISGPAVPAGGSSAPWKKKRKAAARKPSSSAKRPKKTAAPKAR